MFNAYFSPEGLASESEFNFDASDHYNTNATYGNIDPSELPSFRLLRLELYILAGPGEFQLAKLLLTRIW